MATGGKPKPYKKLTPAAKKTAVAKSGRRPTGRVGGSSGARSGRRPMG